MSKQTMWLIFAGLAALTAVPLIYLGLQSNSSAYIFTGFGLFTLGMIVTPVMRLCVKQK